MVGVGRELWVGVWPSLQPVLDGAPLVPEVKQRERMLERVLGWRDVKTETKRKGLT